MNTDGTSLTIPPAYREVPKLITKVLLAYPAEAASKVEVPAA